MNKRFEKDINDAYDFNSAFENEIMKSDMEDFVSKYFLNPFGISNWIVMASGKDPFGEIASNDERAISTITTIIRIITLGRTKIVEKIPEKALSKKGPEVLREITGKAAVNEKAKGYIISVTTDLTMGGIDNNNDKKMNPVEKFIKGWVFSKGLGKYIDTIS